VTNSGVTVNYLYDAAGNVTYDGAHYYIYDAENRIVSMDSGASTYAYDHQNRRIKKVVGSSNTHYVWEGSQVIAEYNGSTGAQLVLNYYAGSRMISKIESGALRYFLSDRLSARVVLDLNGNVVGRQAHLPFGEDFGETGTQEKHHFTSYERDGEAASDYAVNREYSQNVGRFMRVDPMTGSLRNPQSLDRYSYVANDPIGRTDPSGLEPFSSSSGWQISWMWNWFFNWSGWFEGPNFNSPPPSEGPNIPVNLDIFNGYLKVEGNCTEHVIYVREDNKEKKTNPAGAWSNAPRDVEIPADFVATPRGIVKIPGSCHCFVSCSDGKDYEILCYCSLYMFGTGPTVLTDGEMHDADMVADPRRLWEWVASSPNRYGEPRYLPSSRGWILE
jgi:RHS repeat-associated protein